MTHDEIMQRVEELRRRPLMVLCRTKSGSERVMTLVECVTTGAEYISLIEDDLDKALAKALEGDKKTIEKKETEK